MALNRLILFITALIFTVLSVSAGQIPESGNLGIDYQGRLTVIADMKNSDPYLEVLGRFDSEASRMGYRHIMVGSYYRIHRNLKLGAFYLLQSGVLHDDDWLFLNPGWNWDDTKNRLENNLILRPLGNVIYLCPPLCTTEEEIGDILERTFEVIRR